MVLKRSLYLLCLGTLFAAAPEAKSALVTFHMEGAFFQDAFGGDIPAGTLFQLVNLGANGVFDPISLGDGSTAGLNQWVTGDDTVIDVPSGGSDYTSPKAFDLTEGADTPGVLGRTFVIETSVLPIGQKIGVRWFTGLQASNFGTITLTAGQKYGEFTRQATGTSLYNTAEQDPSIFPADNARLYAGPKNGNALWVMTDGGTVDLDNMVSLNATGTDPAAISQTIRVVIPEPATIGLSFLGLAAVLGIRRRRL
jgi:hypothetical protein